MLKLKKNPPPLLETINWPGFQVSFCFDQWRNFSTSCIFFKKCDLIEPLPVEWCKSATWCFSSDFSAPNFSALDFSAPRLFSSKTFQPQDFSAPRLFSSKTFQLQDFSAPIFSAPRLFSSKTFQLLDVSAPRLFSPRCFSSCNFSNRIWIFMPKQPHPRNCLIFTASIL